MHRNPRRWSGDRMTIIGVAILAVLLVIAGLTLRTRNKNIERTEYEHEQQHYNSTNHNKQRKAQRNQSKNARRKRH
jgi:uncharacterized protein YxeA